MPKDHQLSFETKPLAEQCEIVRELERTTIARYLRGRHCPDPHHDERWCPTCSIVADVADEIETAAHHVQ